MPDIYYKTGIQTPEGLRFEKSGLTDTKCYGYRQGTEEEAKTLGYKQVQDVSISTPSRLPKANAKQPDISPQPLTSPISPPGSPVSREELQAMQQALEKTQEEARLAREKYENELAAMRRQMEALLKAQQPKVEDAEEAVDLGSYAQVKASAKKNQQTSPPAATEEGITPTKQLRFFEQRLIRVEKKTRRHQEVLDLSSSEEETEVDENDPGRQELLSKWPALL